jgi:hypothetical protein
MFDHAPVAAVSARLKAFLSDFPEQAAKPHDEPHGVLACGSMPQ